MPDRVVFSASSAVFKPGRSLVPRICVAVAGVALISLAGCDRDKADTAPVDATPIAPTTEPATKTPIVVTLPAMTRSDMVQAAARAASAYSGGEDLTGTDPTVGRTFSVRVPFGCGGPASPTARAPVDGLPQAVRDAANGTIKLTMTPGAWLDSALIANTDSDWEEIEGIWIPQPWMMSEACPAVRPDPLGSGVIAPALQTVGLAAVHEQDGSRIGRRNGRAYSYTLRGEGDQPVVVPPGGWRMRLEGRVIGFPAGRAFRCRASDPSTRPVCIAAIQLDRVAFEDASGQMLSEWRPGQG